MPTNQSGSHGKTNDNSDKGSGSGMPGKAATRGSSHDQHVKPGEQSHKGSGSANEGSKRGGENVSTTDSSDEAAPRGGSHEQHVNAGKQSHKNS